MDLSDVMAPAICPGLVCLLECRTAQASPSVELPPNDDCPQLRVHAQIPTVKPCAEPGDLCPGHR